MMKIAQKIYSFCTRHLKFCGYMLHRLYLTHVKLKMDPFCRTLSIKILTGSLFFWSPCSIQMATKKEAFWGQINQCTVEDHFMYCLILLEGLLNIFIMSVLAHKFKGWTQLQKVLSQGLYWTVSTQDAVDNVDTEGKKLQMDINNNKYWSTINMLTNNSTLYD